MRENSTWLQYVFKKEKKRESDLENTGSGNEAMLCGMASLTSIRDAIN